MRAGAVVLAWLVATVAVSVAHPFVPAPRWLMVHLLVLGAVSNAVLVWSWHFAAALLKLPEEVIARGRVARLVTHNVGAVLVVAGVVADVWPLVAAGGAAVVAVGGWHAVALVRRMRAALPSRFGTTVRYYVAAGTCLALGATIGVELARGAAGDAGHARLQVAHTALNVLGWIGLTVLGTLVTLWPTMLRTRMTDGSEHVARRGLLGLVAALAVTVGGALGGVLTVAAAGVVAYAAAALVVCRPHLGETRRRPPTAFSTLTVLAAVAWWVGVLGWVAVGLATAGDWAAAEVAVDAAVPYLLAGFCAQVVLGALAYLVPVVLGGGPAVVRATTAVLDRGGVLRVVVTNGGLLLCALPVPSLVRVLASMAVLVSMATSLPLAVRAVVVARRLRDAGPVRAAAVAPPAPRPGGGRGDGATASDGVAAARRLGAATAGLAVLVLTAAVGVAADPAAAGLPTSRAAASTSDVVATGGTTTVRVAVEGMRFVPDVVRVPAGDRLVVELDNTGGDRHDLVLENGARTERLAPGQSQTLDVGVVGADLDGWCSVAGHRQMGMTLTVEVVGAAAGASGDDGTGGETPSGPGHHGHGTPAAADDGPDAGAPSAAEDVDLAASPGPGFEAHDASLPPAADATVHRLTLTVREVEREVAPGVRQRLWTFGGTAPGPTLRGRVGDVFEVTLVNDGSIGHSIDFHAGALAPDRPMRTIQPGESLVYRFTATRAGAWLYHCSTAPMSLHIANGMFGAVVIDPPDLPAVDREYLLVQSELYLGPQGGVADADRMLTQRADLVVFNGYANQYQHDPLEARVGERVRIWVVAAGPQRGSAFHVVGGQFDTLWQEGAYRLRPDATSGGAQVLDLAPAAGGFVETVLPEAGRYPFVTHAMLDAERGAHGVIAVRP
ncbi:multicopper oxidase domain-containing protein [Thalassiella azotivora]